MPDKTSLSGSEEGGGAGGVATELLEGDEGGFRAFKVGGAADWTRGSETYLPEPETNKRFDDDENGDGEDDDDDENGDGEEEEEEGLINTNQSECMLEISHSDFGGTAPNGNENLRPAFAGTGKIFLLNLPYYRPY